MGMRIIVGVIGVESNITALRVGEPPSPRKKESPGSTRRRAGSRFSTCFTWLQ
jgi:hypothetical protein